MTTSYCTLTGTQGGLAFDVTDAGDAFTEMVDELSNLSLYECMKGQAITGWVGSHAAGASFIRVRNTVSNKVKCLEALDVITEETLRYFDRPFVIEQDDILECFHVVVPT